jgi:hypothetical protein
MILCLSVILAAAIALTTPYVNEDLYLAFAAGRDISEGIVAAPDHWSFNTEGRVWINQAWLSHYLFYVAYEYLGSAGPVGLKLILFAACVALTLLQCRWLGADIETSLAAAIPGILASGPFLGIRPENFGLFFFILFTSFLTAGKLSKFQRRFAIPVVMVIWSNFHGSFMMGLGFLWIKCLLVTWRAYRKELPSRIEAAEWCLVALLSTILPGILSPFGLDNLLMPFKQVGTRAVTEYSADWLPLLTFDQMSHGFLGGSSIYPYLIFVVGLLIFACISQKFGKRGYFRKIRGDATIELVIALVTIIMAFRFRRLVLFSALAVVPLLSALIQSTKEGLKASNDRAIQTESLPNASNERQGGSRGERTSRISMATATLCLVMMLFLFWRAAVVPYLPSNPFRPERTVGRELMSFDSFSPSLVKFIRTNGIGETDIGERILVGWELSPYLMQAMPQIKLFMDCRDQSIYPDTIATDYFTILGVIHRDGRDPLALLDEYGVTAIALTTNPIDLQAAINFMQSRKWACIYADPDAILLVRSDSGKFKDALQSELNGLWFPDEDSRILSTALLSHFVYGSMSPDTLKGLKAAVAANPWPNYYTLIVWGMDSGSACFKYDTFNYMVSEALRLGAIDFGSEKRGASALESLVRIYEILQMNALKCGEEESALKFNRLKNDYQLKYDQLKDKFLGRFF